MSEGDTQEQGQKNTVVEGSIANCATLVSHDPTFEEKKEDTPTEISVVTATIEETFTTADLARVVLVNSVSDVDKDEDQTNALIAQAAAAAVEAAAVDVDVTAAANAAAIAVEDADAAAKAAVEEAAQTKKNEQRRKRYREKTVEEDNTDGGSSTKKKGGSVSHEDQLAARREKDRQRYANMTPEQRRAYNAKRREQYHRQSENSRQKRRERERMRYHSLTTDMAKDRNARRAKLERERYQKLSPQELEIKNRKRRERAALSRHKSGSERGSISGHSSVGGDSVPTAEGSQEQINSSIPMEHVDTVKTEDVITAEELHTVDTVMTVVDEMSATKIVKDEGSVLKEEGDIVVPILREV